MSIEMEVEILQQVGHLTCLQKKSLRRSHGTVLWCRLFLKYLTLLGLSIIPIPKQRKVIFLKARPLLVNWRLPTTQEEKLRLGQEVVPETIGAIREILHSRHLHWYVMGLRMQFLQQHLPVQTIFM